MKKTGIFIILFTFALSVFSQNKTFTQKVEKYRDKLYLSENNEHFEIDLTVVTVKLISSSARINKKYKVLNIDRSGYLDLQVPENVDIIKFVEKLKQSGMFESVEYNGICKSCQNINDPFWSSQYLDLSLIKLKDAWKITMGNPNIKVAILDSGIEVSHEDIGYGTDGYSNVSLTLGRSYSGSSNAHQYPTSEHGTAVAGIIGAKTNNGKGIAGVAGGDNAQGVTLIPYCVTSSYHVRDAIYDAVDAGAKVINISKSMNQMSSLDEAIQYAYNHNVTIVCASGNNGGNTICYPASHSQTIAVGACYKNGNRINDSQYGAGLDLVAPGDYVETTGLNNSYTSLPGTSFATPYVTGTIALMLSIDSLLTPNEIRTTLHNSCTQITNYNYNSSGWNEEIGYGVLNVKDAVAAVAFKIVGPSLACTDTPYSVACLPAGMHVVWSLENTSCGCIFETDTPAVNQCCISSINNPFTGTLRASIYNGTELFFTRTKHVYTLSGTRGRYMQESCLYYNKQHPAIPYTTLNGVAFVHQGCMVILESPYFEGATVTHSGVTPEQWLFDPDHKRLYFSFPLGSGGIPLNIIVHGENSCGDTQFTFFSVSNNGNLSSALNVEPLSDGYLLTINNHSEEITTNSQIVNSTDNGEHLVGRSSENNWDLDVYSATWGKKEFGCKVKGNNYYLNTNGWNSGLYVIRVVIDGKVYTEKINVR